MTAPPAEQPVGLLQILYALTESEGPTDSPGPYTSEEDKVPVAPEPRDHNDGSDGG